MPVGLRVGGARAVARRSLLECRSMPGAGKRVGVIDVGTNSARLLVADVEDGRVAPLERRSTVTRLGRGVDLTGRLSAEAIEDACAAIAPYMEALRELEAETV